jgi:hypothetical protein
MTMLNIKNISKADILATLYNATTQGVGKFKSTAHHMTVAAAQKLLDRGNTCFDHIQGKTVKIRLIGDTLSTVLYDRENGQGAAAFALADLLKGKS